MSKSGFRGGDHNINRAGKKPGTPNKVTKEIRTAYQNLVEMNLDNMTMWLSQVAAEDPNKAMELMLKLSEYVIPRLARQEITGADGSDLLKDVRFNFGPNINDETNRIQDLE